jgi:hypothetical protein
MLAPRSPHTAGHRLALWMFVGILLGAGISAAGIGAVGSFSDAPRAAVGSFSTAASSPLRITGLSVNPNPVSQGSQFTVSVQVTGGAQPYSYGWNSVPGGCPIPGNISSWTCSLSSSGQYSVGVIVKDAGGNQTSAAQGFNVSSNNGNQNGKSGSSNGNGNGSNGFNLSAFGPFLVYGLIAAVVAFALLVALTVGVIVIAVVLSRRLPRQPRGSVVCASCQAAAPAGSKFCPSCAAPLTPPKQA